MKRGLLFSLAVLGMVVAGVSAQDVKFRKDADRESEIDQSVMSPGAVTPTVEMWFYEQALRRYNDPKVAVRSKAEYRSVQRQRRMAAMSWFGYSNSRPTVTITPTMTPYSPSWVSNSYHREQWRGAGGTVYVTPRSDSLSRRLW